MNKQELAPFYVGQEVEAVATHDQHLKYPQCTPVKGRKYTVTGIKNVVCCGWSISIGLFNEPGQTCAHGIHVGNGSELFFLAKYFRAITPAMEAVTFEKITEQHPVSVN